MMLIRKGLVVKTQEKKKLIFFILAFTGWIVGFAFTEIGFAKEARKPNVVIMLADNLGYGDLSSYNGGIRGEMRTPNIDKLAAEGMRLTQFLVEPGCTPSRSGLQTGRYSIRSGLSLVIAPGVDGGLAKDEYTIGEMFKSVGYATTYVGKWHLGPLARSQPQNQGYDQWLLGFNGSTDSTLYAQSMKQIGMPKSAIEKSEPQVFEAKGPGKVTRVRPYNVEYRKQIEADIAKTSTEYIRKQAQTKEPFFLMIGWTRPHFPNETMDQFKGASKVNQYGDSVVELDHHTGTVLKAIKDAGIEDNTIVIWISDNGPTVTATSLNEIHAGDTGPFRGELGDAYEGSIRTAGMIKWPEKIKPTVSNEMFSIHDFLPTLAKIVEAKLPGERPIDGIDQSEFLLGKQIHSSRNDLLTFIGDRLVAVRWKQFRFYPMQISNARNNPARGGYLGIMQETAGFPQIYNIEADPKEKVDIAIESYGWTIAPYLKAIAKYQATLKKYPNPPAGNVAKF